MRHRPPNPVAQAAREAARDYVESNGQCSLGEAIEAASSKKAQRHQILNYLAGVGARTLAAKAKEFEEAYARVDDKSAEEGAKAAEEMIAQGVVEMISSPERRR